MSDLLQSGHHPDADQLTAFVEHALPLHEYEQTLAHLAVCPDCRSIVALSMPPLDEPPVLLAEAIRKLWFSGWKLAWPTAVAFAALAIVVLYLRNTTNLRSTAVLTQRSDSRPPLPVPAPEKSQIPNKVIGPVSDQGRMSASNTKNTVGVSSRNSAALPNQNGDLRAQAQTSPARNAKSINGHQPDSFIAGAVGGSGNGSVLSQNFAPTITDPLHQNLINAGTAATAASSASPAAIGGPINGSLRKSEAPMATLPSVSDAATLNVFDQNTEVTIATAPVALPFNGRNIGLNQGGGVLVQHPLPSHLPAISMVSANHQILAIDTQNSLFFSGDDGKSWKAIASQWKGRAVKVALVSSAALAKVSSGIAVSTLASSTSFAPQATPTREQRSIAGSTLTGKVADASGAAIPDAAVVVTGTEAGNVHSVKTDHSGSYVIGGLAPGHYQIAARAPGFQEQVSAVNVAASAQSLASFTLPVGSATETVEVQATSMPIPLADASITTKKIAELPAASATLLLFEITTEDGNQWTSNDGQTWKHK